MFPLVIFQPFLKATCNSPHYTVYPKCLDKLQELIIYTNTKKEAYINVCPQTVFELCAHVRPDVSSLDFCLWGHLKILVYLKMERHVTDAFFCPCQTIRNSARTFDRLRQSVIRRVNACIDSSEHFRICCKL